MNRKVTIHYFAALREAAGCAQETVTTQQQRVDELFEEIKRRRGFVFKCHQVKFAVNEQFCGPEAAIKNGDSIFFMPPVCGG